MLTNDPDADGERGVIVNTSSDAGEDGTTGMLGYAATKAALIGMTLPAAREFAGRGIRVNTIVAGGFDTPILDVTGRAAAASQIKFFANPPPAGQTRRIRGAVRTHRRKRLLQRRHPPPRRRLSNPAMTRGTPATTRGVTPATRVNRRLR
jgi:NAD(P)-dependent dehydrogenase (short-subunit alcohol dehydrogenase family)